MGEARDLFESLAADLEARSDQSSVSASRDVQHHGLTMLAVATAIRRALATQPEPDPVPELPEFVECDEDGDYIVHFDNRLGCCLAPHYRAEDYDRIAEAARILAARERARRAS